MKTCTGVTINDVTVASAVSVLAVDVAVVAGAMFLVFLARFPQKRNTDLQHIEQLSAKGQACCFTSQLMSNCSEAW